MKKSYLFLAATAILAFASCADNTYLGDQEGATGAGGAISFGFDVPSATRASGSTAATALSNQFIVWGEKNETDANKAVVAGADDPSNSRTGHLVFPNYIVNWVDHAHSTTSNSNGWEYVGFKFDDGSATIVTTNYSTYVTPNAKSISSASESPAQTIKYWDMAASKYVFTAVSALPADITAGKVTIAKKTYDATSVYNKGYTVAVTEDADLAHLYFSDRVYMDPGTSPVTLTFRNSISQVRVGMYETVPGYDVKVTKFYYATSHAASTPAFSDMTNYDKEYFVADIPNVSPASDKTSVAGTFTVNYFPKNEDNDAAGITNRPTVSFIPTTGSDSKITLSLGDGVYNTKLNESSATPTYDKTAGAFTTVFPQETNNTNLLLKIDYQLYNTTTGETIDFEEKTAVVPAQYLQWKPNYKYTYIFKISDNDLKPITFDAVQIEAENGNVEYITTVDQPSITTYQNGSAVTTDNEYKASKTIYVVVEDGTELVVDANAKLYTAFAQSGYKGGLTEASVANALKNGADVSGSKVVTDEGGKTLTITPAVGLTAFTTIPAADSPTGADLTIKGAKFTTAASTTYVFQYLPLVSEAVNYTAATAATHNAGLINAISTATELTADEAAALNNISGVSKTSYATGENPTAEDAILYNATLPGAVTTDDIETPAVYAAPENCHYKVIKVQ